MQLDKIYIKGFRNFKEATINLSKHSLIIGANDVGKTNMIYAIRILLDRSFSDYDFELQESDFYAYENTDNVIIRLYFSNITEECIVARMPGKLSANGELVLEYEAKKNGNKVDYTFKCGKSDSCEDLTDCTSPYYRKWLNLKYISSRRDLWGYINKTKKTLLTQAMGNRNEDTIACDDALKQEIETHLSAVDTKIPELSYVKNATKQINTELDNLSIHNKEQRIVFDTTSTDVDRMIRNVNIVSKHNDRKLVIGGEGRANQIYLSLWASQNQHTETSTEVSIICIEEPEAYLHPHQQRKLADYLGNKLNGQVILTSHSPYIVSEFSPNSIVRLYKDKNSKTFVASDGCSKVIEEGIEGLGYRMSVIPAESFFSDCVFLVEGPSEVLLYKALAQQLNIDLDNLNISILSVDGVAFTTFIKILDAMHIAWIMRTDNDCMKVPQKKETSKKDALKEDAQKEEYRYAGIERGVDCFMCSKYMDDAVLYKPLEDKIKLLRFENKDNPPDNIQKIAHRITNFLNHYHIEISNVDLETDLFDSELCDDLKDFYKSNDKKKVIDKMKSHKAINMYNFLKSKKDSLIKLKDNKLAAPLLIAKSKIEELYGTYTETE